MNNKYFKISYQGVREFFNLLVFGIVMWYISSKYLWIILIQPNDREILSVFLGITSPITLTLWILFVWVIIFLLYHLSASIVSLAYWLYGYKLNETKWYSGLTQKTIKIPLTKNQFWAIENHPKFAAKACKEDKHLYMVYAKLDKWAEKIIEKELTKLGGRKQ